MDDFSLTLDKSIDDIQDARADFSVKLGERIVESSGGELDGFTATRVDDPIRGYSVDTDFSRAKLNVNLARDINPDSESAVRRASKRLNLPVTLVRAMDNQELSKPDVGAYAQETQRFIGDSVSNAAVIKGDEDRINDVVETAQYAARSPEDRRAEMLAVAKVDGYSPEQISDLRAAGFLPLPDDPTGKSGKFRSGNITVNWPVLTKWFSGPGAVAFEQKQQKAREQFMSKVLSLPLKDRKAAMLDYVKDYGYTPKQVSDMRERGILVDDHTKAQVMTPGGTLSDFVLEEWYATPEEIREDRQRREATKDWPSSWFSMSPEDRKSELLTKIRKDGYTPEQIADLEKRGYLVPDPKQPKAYQGKIAYTDLVLENWYTAPNEIDTAARKKDTEKRMARYSEMNKHAYDRVRGSAWLANATEETAIDYIKRLDKEIVVMKFLYSMYGDKWHGFSDKHLNEAIQEVGAASKIDVSDMSAARFRKVGVGWETDWASATNWFGAQDVLASRGKLSQEELDAVHRDPNRYDMADLMELVDHLEEQARELRTRTGWNVVTEGVLGSISFMTEFAATAGVSVTPSAAKEIFKGGFLKGLPKFLGALAKGEAKRLPAYLPKVAGEAIGEAMPEVTQTVGDGEVLPGMTEERTSELANIFFNKILDLYIENMSEGMGAALPTGKLLKPLGNLIPQKIKNTFFVQVMKNTAGNIATSKGAKVARTIMEKTGFNGFAPEYMEEIIGDAARVVSTNLAHALGTDFGDLGQVSVFGTVDEELQRMGTLLITSQVVSAPRAVTIVGDVRRAIQFVDAERAIKDRVDASATEQRSPEAMEILLRDYTNMSDTAYLSPEDARTLFQSQPEVMAEIGVPENVIAAAENAEQMIPISMARVHTHTDRAAFDEIVARAVPDPKHTLNMEQAEKVDLSAEAQAVAEATDKARSEVRSAYDDAITQLTALGRPAREIRAFSKLLSMAEYFGQHSNMTAAEWIRNVAFEKAKEEDFLKRLSGNEAVLSQVSPVWTGAAANYEKPSLQYVGTGEGAQVYGWGLYGSSNREIAEWYANADHKRKNQERVSYGEEFTYQDLDRGTQSTTGLDSTARDALKVVISRGGVEEAKDWCKGRISYFSNRKSDYIAEGRSPDQLTWLDDQVRDMEQQLKFLEEEGDYVKFVNGAPIYLVGGKGYATAEELIDDLDLANRYGEHIREGIKLLTEVAGYESKKAREETLEYIKSVDEEMDDPAYVAAARFMEDFPDFEIRLPRNLYKQTFWPGRQEDLLDWDEEVQLEQIEKVVKGLAGILVDRGSLYNFAVFDTVKGVASERGFSRENSIPQIEAELIIGEHLDIHHGYKSGEGLYNYVTDILGSSPRTASEFLYRAGIDGITYIGDSSGVRNYVAFSDADIRVDDHIMYQGEGQHRGAISFNDAWEATVALFEGAADASTIIHETAHYAFEMMRHLVETGAADERMQSDFAVLKKWSEEGTADFTEQRERLAKAFEAYVLEGKAPTIELEGAFSTLRSLLMHIYKSVKALGVKLTDEVRTVFDGMLASDETILNQSIFREVASQINKELLGLTAPEVKVFRDLIEKSNAQAIAELAEEKNRQLAKLRPQWRNEATDLMNGDRVYKAWNAIMREGGIDYVALEEIVGEERASALRKKGLTTNPGRKSKAKVDKKTGEVVRPAGYYSAKIGKHPASFAAENGFDSVEQMVDELFSAKSPKDFTSEYMAEQERKFNAEFEISESALSVQASVDALEKLSELLAVKGGREGYAVRRAMLKRQALEEIHGMTVNDIVNDRKLILSCRQNARKLTKATNDGDFTTAFDQAQKLRYNIELLRQKGAAKKEIAKIERLMLRGRRAKKGYIHERYKDALTDLSLRFGFLKREPSKPLWYTVADVMEDYNTSAKENGEATIDVPPLLLSGRQPFGTLTFGGMQDVGHLASFLYGEGRALVSEKENALKEQVKSSVESCLSEMQPLKHNKVKHYGLIGLAYEVPLWGTKLRNILGEAGQWKQDSAFQKLYDEMVYAAGMQYELMAEPTRVVREALKALHKSISKLDFNRLSHIKFPSLAIAYGYKKWDAEKVVMCCLNMGTYKNRQRLKDGFSNEDYEWTEDTLNEIASLLTEEDWGHIQNIWDALGKGNLTHLIKKTFEDEYHYALTEEEAYAFPVLTADGVQKEIEGGYFPLDYLYHGNTVIQDKVEANASNPAFRRADFTFTRAEKVTDPLKLSVSIIESHIFDAAHYVSHRAVMRKIMRVINDTEFRKEFQLTQGFEKYDALKKLVENVAAPGAAMKGFTSRFEDWTRAIITANALWLNPSSTAMQFSSVTIGTDELGHYWYDALADTIAHPKEAKDEVLIKSGMMRERLNTPDLDLRRSAGYFSKSEVERVRDLITEFGYTPMRYVDLAVAIPAWRAAFYQATDKGFSERKAVAIADEFVAKTQGATRALDMSPAQLTAWGRCVTVFFTAVSAGYTMASRTVKRAISGEASAGEAVASIATNIVVPVLLSAAIRALLAGSPDDDPDKARRAFYREILSSPFQGTPLVRDAADFVAGGVSRELTDKPFMQGQRTVFENTAFRGASDITIAVIDGIIAAVDGNPSRALYKMSDAVGGLFKVPVVQVYDRASRMVGDISNDPEILPDLNKLTKQETKKKTNRRKNKTERVTNDSRI